MVLLKKAQEQLYLFSPLLLFLSTGWMIGVLVFDFRRGLGIFLFTTASRTALGPTQPPIQYVPGARSLWAKWPEREADHSPPSSAGVKECVELYLHSPIRLHGVVFSKKKKAQGQLYLLPLPLLLFLNTRTLPHFQGIFWQSVKYDFLLHSSAEIQLYTYSSLCVCF
jgi:hypothetical protein